MKKKLSITYENELIITWENKSDEYVQEHFQRKNTKYLILYFHVWWIPDYHSLQIQLQKEVNPKPGLSDRSWAIHLVLDNLISRSGLHKTGSGNRVIETKFSIFLWSLPDIQI